MYFTINGKEVTRFKIFEQKPKLFIWLLINFLAFWASTQSLVIGLIISIILYALLINFALSDTLENILRRMNDVRRIATSTEKERLNNLFDEVYKNVLNNANNISSEIRLYIQDTMSINAFAIGRKTIVVTRGLMENFTDEQIKAILAHEFSHIVNGDTQLSMLISIGSTIYLWLFVAVKLIFQMLENANDESNVISGTAHFVSFIMDIAIFLMTLIANIAIMSYYRNTEFIADECAYRLGYGEDLLSALYKIYNMEISDQKRLVDRLQSSHPKTAFRIERLEQIVNTVPLFDNINLQHNNV